MLFPSHLFSLCWNFEKPWRLTEEHWAQLEAYLLDGGWAVGLLLNFGGETPQHRRVYVAANDPTRREEVEG